MRAILSYVEMGNELASEAKFYNTLSANCTTIIFTMARVLDPTFPFDYRILLSGYLPGYLYDHGWLENNGTLEEIEKRASIDEKHKRVVAKAIRNGYANKNPLARGFQSAITKN